jgi:hypothetical protein
MTVLPKNTTLDNMEIHIENAYQIIEEHLPFNYRKAVLAKFPQEAGITSGMVRNVKKRATIRIDILNAMVEVALENKKLLENFKELTT